MISNYSKPSIVDSSALLAIVYNETGMDTAKEHFDNSYMSVINAAECLIVLTRNGMPEDIAKNLLESIISKFIPCEYHDADLITKIKNSNPKLGLSLADCTCISLGNKLGLQIITADKEWQQVASKSEIICIR